MKRNINTEEKKNTMRKPFIQLLLCMIFISVLSFTNVFASHNQLIWDFNEGAGNIAFDISDNNNNGFLVNGASHVLSPSITGSSVTFDGNDDVVQANIDITPFVTEQYFVFSGFMHKDDDNLDKVFSFENSVENRYIALQVDNTGNPNWILSYTTDVGVPTTINIDTIDWAKDTWVNVYLEINLNTSQVLLYKDNVLEYNQTITPVGLPSNSALFRVGNGRVLTDGLKGEMDNILLTDYPLNSTQLLELQSGTFPLTEPDAINETPTNETIGYTNFIEQDIIISYSPNSTLDYLEEPFQFSFNLNYQSSCELYFDSSLIGSFNNVLTLQTLIANSSTGEHSMMLYCYYADGNTLNYDTASWNIYVSEGDPQTANFRIIGKDFDITQDDLYLHTPCLTEGFSTSIIEVEGYERFRAENNPEGAYFRQVDSQGRASFNLSSGNHEFCLLTGRMTYQSEDKTNDYQILNVEGYVKIGTINIPNNINPSYTINLEALETYDTTNPKAWGQTWAGIIMGLLMMIIGGIVLVSGISLNNGKIVIAGALIILIGLGFEVTSVVGLVI